MNPAPPPASPSGSGLWHRLLLPLRALPSGIRCLATPSLGGWLARRLLSEAPRGLKQAVPAAPLPRLLRPARRLSPQSPRLTRPRAPPAASAPAAAPLLPPRLHSCGFPRPRSQRRAGLHVRSASQAPSVSSRDPDVSRQRRLPPLRPPPGPRHLGAPPGTNPPPRGLAGSSRRLPGGTSGPGAAAPWT